MDAVKNKGGRPSKYTPELLESAHEYLREWRSQGDMIPSHIGLALHLGINRDTLYAWYKDESKAPFSDILDNIMDLQQKELINNGLSGDFNSAITKLVLGKHGFSEKSEVVNKGATPVQVVESEYVDS